MVIVVDPKVFLRRDSDCSFLLLKLLEAREEEMRIGMNNALWDEYEKYAQKNSEVMDLLQKIWLYPSQYTIHLKYELCGKTQTPLLSSKKCDVEIEPTLLGAGLDETEPIVVYLSQDDIKPERVFPTCLNELRETGLGMRLVSPHEAHKKILVDKEPRYPQNRGELEKLLDEHSVAGRRTEGPRVEFKGHTKLSTGMRIAAAEAVCGMLNGGNGWVLIGVRSDGSIIGFEQEVVDDSGTPLKGRKADAEDVLKAIREEVERIQPDPRALFDYWVIDLGNERIVVVISVLKGDREYTYNGIPFKRKGGETLKPIPPKILMEK